MNPLGNVTQGRQDKRQRAGLRAARLVLAPALPFFTLALQLTLWPYLQPYAWVLFYPTVMASSWIGGFRQGLLATVVSTALVWWFFIPPEATLVKELDRLIPAGVFVGLGVLTAFSHDRLRKANERMRKALEERRIFAAFVDNSSDFIAIADADGKPKYLNPAGRRLVGMAADRSLEGVTIPDFYPPELRATAAAVVEGLAARGEWQAETTLRNWATGEAIPVSQIRFMIRDPDTGKAIGMGSIAHDITERKQLERSLRQTTTDLSHAQSVAGVGSWRLDVRRNELVWSEETYRLFAIPQGTPMTYEAFLACVHPDDREYVDGKWRAALAGEPYDIEHRIVADGQIRWVREKAELDFDEQGELLGGIGIVQDLTERKRLEDELRLSEARSSGIVSISADAIVSIDEQQRITMFNEGAERTFGYTKAEAIGAPVEVLMPERFRTTHRRHVEEFASGSEVARRMGAEGMAIVGLRKNGEEFPASASISKLEVAGKRILTAAVRDVSEEKRVETEQRFLAEVGSVLAETLDYEQTLSNIVALAVRDLADYCVVDLIGAGGEVRRFKVGCRDPANAWICDVLTRVRIDRKQPYLTGLPLEARRTVLLERITPEMLLSFARDEEHLAALRAIEARSAVVAPLIAHGRLLGAIGVVSAKTSRPHDERDMPLVEELARRAALSVENATLFGAAQRAIESRDDVMGIVAHDLRSPLTTIVLQAARLAQHEGNSVKEHAEAIGRAAGRMNRLIRDLLDVTRMEAGRLPLDQARVSVGHLIEDVVAAQRPLAVAAALDLQVELAPDLPDVWADRDRVLQVFENLVGNALKFTERGGRVTIGAALRDGDVRFWVSDTGVGIAPEDQTHVFDRFWQARRARRHGAGLGLPIVKGIVEAHGGRIWLESAPGRGTTFFLTIPPAAVVTESPAHAAHGP